MTSKRHASTDPDDKESVSPLKKPTFKRTSSLIAELSLTETDFTDDASEMPSDDSIDALALRLSQHGESKKEEEPVKTQGLVDAYLDVMEPYRKRDYTAAFTDEYWFTMMTVHTFSGVPHEINVKRTKAEEKLMAPTGKFVPRFDCNYVFEDLRVDVDDLMGQLSQHSAGPYTYPGCFYCKKSRANLLIPETAAEDEIVDVEKPDDEDEGKKVKYKVLKKKMNKGPKYFECPATLAPCHEEQEFMTCFRLVPKFLGERHCQMIFFNGTIGSLLYEDITHPPKDFKKWVDEIMVRRKTEEYQTKLRQRLERTRFRVWCLFDYVRTDTGAFERIRARQTVEISENVHMSVTRAECYETNE